MRRELTYEDAVRILGGGEHRLLKYLDQASTVGLFALGGFNFFEVRKEFVSLGGDLVTRLSERLRGIDRLTRAERLVAAHQVIAITAYFDALGDAIDLLGPVSPPRITARDQLTLISGEHVDAGWREVVDHLTTISSLQPTPVSSHEGMTRWLRIEYQLLSISVEQFIKGLALWDQLDETQRDRFSRHVKDVLPGAAVEKYREMFQRLIVDCPEFAVWIGLAEHRATRVEVRAGLTALEDVLERIGSGALPDVRRVALARAYQAALRKPITVSGEFSANLQIPTLGEGYIDHRFRAAAATVVPEPGRESYWADLPTRDDIHNFLARFLSSPQACEAPLLVLGHPGSGKSVLTRVLAARLPVTDFLPVRVELRQVPAEADLQDQIELAVRQTTGESLSWPRLVESAPGALPVVLLDGFDELLQATGVTQTDFLLKVAAFQEREADQGRPVAVVVTSRIAVANRAALPPESIVLRLEPFNDQQIAAWLDIWHRVNATTLTERGLHALPVNVALQHRELAEQPLLLLMLALHDANVNALQKRVGQGPLSRTKLYEQLLRDFARREVIKQPGAMTEPELDRAVETELLRLAVVAFAMFNRRSQWISEADLNRDLAALLGDRADARNPSGLRAPLTAAQIVVGRFFFVHEAQATRDGQQLQTYEFLHATFSEFLVARLVTQVLTDMVKRETATTHLLPGGIDDGLLHALLSFAALTARAPVVTFLGDLLGRLTALQRTLARDLLLRLHRTASHARAESAYAAYQPDRRPLADRLTVWSANLVLLAVLVGGEVMGDELFTEGSVAVAWRDEAMTWRARLTSEEWSGMINAIGIERVWTGERRNIRLLLDDGTFAPEPIDLSWTYSLLPEEWPDRGPIKWSGHLLGRIDRKGNFTGGKSNDVMSHALEPIGEAFPELANALFPVESGQLISLTHALLAALVEPVRQDDPKSSAYSDLVEVVQDLVVTNTSETPHPELQVLMKTTVALLWLAKHRAHLPEPTFEELQRLLKDLT